MSLTAHRMLALLAAADDCQDLARAAYVRRAQALAAYLIGRFA